MKKVLLFVFAVMMVFFVSAQTVVFQEGFESGTVGLTTTADSAGFPTTNFQSWAASTNLYKSGVKADSNVLQTGKTIYFTTNSFSTTGNAYVILEFSQICKLYFADGGIIEVSVDGGTTWTSLGTAEYQGTGNLITSGGVSKFSDNAYTDWAAGTNTIPTNSWWKDEKFDISAIAGNKADVKIRFKYTGSGNPGGIGRYGWLLDDIKVTAALSELNPPVITMISYPIDTAYYGGPYYVSAYVKDASGIDTVYISYKVGNGAFTQLGMVKSPTIDSLYTGEIPYVGFGKVVTYNINAKDASSAHNMAYNPNTGYYSFYTKYSSGGNVIIGTGTAGQNYPFKANADYTKSASLYKATDVNRFGLITQLQWNVSIAAASVNVPVKIYIKQTSATAMTADTWDNLKSGAILVYDDTQIFTATGWKTITLTTPFNYNSGSLMILCEANNGTAATSSPSFRYSTGTTGTHQYFSSSTVTTGTLSTSRPNITIGFVVVPLPTPDAGISQITSPTGSVIAGTAFDVNVKIKNFTNDTLKKANIYYTIDGGTPAFTVWTHSGLLKDSTFVYTAANLTLAVGAHTLKVWTDMPNDSTDQNNANDTAAYSFYACSGPLSGTYTVGGTGADFATFADIYTGLSQCGVSGPVVFNIASGTYSEQLTIPEVIGVSATNTITFQSATNDSTAVIFNYASTAAANWIVKLNGADYITFKNIKFAPADSANSTAVVMTAGATNNKLIGNYFVGYAGTATAQSLISIEGTTPANTDNLIQGNRIENGSYAISAKGLSAARLKNTIIKNNSIYDAVVYGVYVQYADTTTIDSNTVISSNTNANKYGIYLQYGNHSNVITKNTVNLTGGTNMYGILTETSISTDTTKGLIANNFVSIIDGTNYAYGIRLNTTTKYKVYANSVITNGANATDTRAINIVSSSSAIDLKNNNLQSNKYPIHVEGSTSVAECDYNNYYSTGTTFGYWNTTSYNSFATLVAASLKDSNSVSVNPYFNSVTDLHTFNGLLKGMGTNLTDVTIDIDGAPRLNPPCIGADEFLPPANDASLITILKPIGGCGLTSTEDVTVVIKNVGTDAILPNTMTARYKIDSLNAVVSELVNLTINPGDTAHYTFTTKANLAVPVTLNDTTFKIRAWTDLTGDFAYANDSSATLTFSSMYMPSPPTVTNGSTLYATSLTLNAVSSTPIAWYDSLTSVTPFHTGSSYTTPLLFATDTFYVASKTSQSSIAYVGAIAPLSTAGTGGGLSTYMNFTALANTTLQAVDIFPYGTGVGTVTIELRTSTGTPIMSQAVTVTGTSSPLNPAQTAILNFPVTAGTSYRLGVNSWTGGVSNLYRDLTGTYPYTIPGVLSITGPSLTPYYYFFYNWKVGTTVEGCVSDKVPIIATVIVPPKESGISAISTPTGCALYQIPVTIDIFNHGSDTLNSTNTTATYKLDNGSFITPEAINVVVPPFDTVQYTFTTLADFTAPTVDRFIKVTAKVITPGDALSINDTLVKDSILSRFTPPAPTANNVSTFYGYNATLTATAPTGTINWFYDLTGGTAFGQGSPFITPPMVVTDTFYVEANTDYSATAIIGTGTTYNSTTSYPSPYTNYYGGTKHQMLILASELSAAGISAGPISSISFNVNSLGSTFTGSLLYFQIDMKNTTTSVLNSSSFESGLTTVYGPLTQPIVTGINTHTLVTGFNWDGVSNLLIQTSYSNGNLGGSGDYVEMFNSPTSFVSTSWYRVDSQTASTVLGATTPTSSGSSRPNIKLDGMVPGCASVPRVPVIVTVSPPPQNDAGVTALVNPLGNTPANVSTPIQVKIKNYGQANLTSAVVEWTLNGIPKPAYNFTGNVLNGLDTVVTIANETFRGGVYCVKAWTKNPNGILDSAAFNDTLQSACFTACLNGTYTIGDTNALGTIFDFPTFNSAVNTLNIAGVCGSVTFLVDTGTYIEQVRIPEITGASAVNTITFRSASNDSTEVILQYSATSTNNNYTLLLDSADYVRIERMTIKATGTSYGRVVELRNSANYNIISNNIIEMPVTNSSDYAGIYTSGTIEEYNTFENNIIINGYYGIYNYGSSSSSLEKGNIIEGNTINGFYYYGIYSYYQDSVIINRNTIENGSNSGTVYGIYARYNDNLLAVSKNKVHVYGTGSNYGIYIYNCDNSVSQPGIIANNFISQSGSSTGTAYGLYQNASTYQNFYYNSVNITSASTTSGRAIYSNGGSNINLYNNIFSNTGGGYAYYINTTSAINNSDHNNMYATGPVLAYWSANRNTLNDLKVASTLDSNSVSGDPLFTSTTDLHLLSTNLSLLGIPIAGITDDIDGFVRDTLHPTIGADEVPLIQHDAGVTFISRPDAVEIEAAIFPVKVAVKNFGTSPITSVMVSYVLNGGVPVDYTYTPTIPIASLATDTVTFPANMTVPAGNNTICAYTTLAGDSNVFNNQTCKNFWGTPLYDAQLATILPISEGCNLTSDTVNVLIVNQGIMPIHGGLTVTYHVIGSPTVVTETVSDSIPVGGVYIYKFNTLVNLAVTTMDSTYRINAWATLINDNIHSNDTVADTLEVHSLHTPANPVTSNVSIPYATWVSLTATSATNDPLKWFDVPAAGTSIYTGSPFVTPMLFATDTFYVESSTASSFNAEVGTGTSTQTYPFYTNWGYTRSASIYQASEIGGFGMINELQWYVATTSTLNVPIKIYLMQTSQTSMTADTWANLISSATLVYDGTELFDAAGWKSINLTSSFNYVSDNLMVLCEANVGGTGASPIPYFRYTTAGTGSHQYMYNDNTPPSGTGNLSASRPNIKISGNVAGCLSARMPAIVTVGAQPAFDMGAVSIVTPSTGVNLSNHDTVRVLVRNYGSQPISNFSVSYKLDNNAVVTDLVALSTPLAAGTYTHTFTQTVDLSSNNQPDTFNIVAWTTLTGDPTPQNDTTKKMLINLPPSYCISTATSTADEDLGQVLFAGIIHGNPLPVLNNPAANQTYNNYTDSIALRATIQPGMNYPISLGIIFANGSYTGKVNAYIDYNRNGNWDLPEELVFTAIYNGTTNSTVTGIVNVPYTAVPGLTRMRIVVDESDNAPACGTYSWGETEDYTVRIIPPIPHDGGISKIGTGTFIPYTTANPLAPYFYIRNYGSDTLASADIKYTLNGVLQPNIPWSKTPALQSLEIDSIQASLTLAYGMNTIVAYTSGIIGDSNVLNDTTTAKVFKEYMTTPPYADNFEVNKYWFASDTASGLAIDNQWVQGIPTSTLPSLNAVHSPVNAWVTGLSADYPDDNYSVLYSPVFDINTMNPDTLKFWHWINSESSFDGGHIEYLNALGDWSVLGHHADTNAVNWYNDSTTTPHMWSGTDTVWHQSMYKVSNLTNLGNILQFRFVFTSDGSTVSKGWAIDDFELTLASIPQDGGVIAINTPTSTSLVGDQVTVNVTVKNFGTDQLTNIPVKYQVNAGAIVTDTIMGILAPGATVNHNFTQTFQVGIQSYTIRAYTDVVNDLYIQNDTTKKTVTVNPAANDIGIEQILLPGASVSFGTPVAVKVRIKNFGTQTQTSFPVAYLRSNSPQGVVTEPWTGSLPAGGTVDYTFITKVIVPSGGTSFNMMAYTSLGNDAYRVNDTLNKSVNLCSVTAAGAISGNVNPLPGSTATYSIPAITNATSYNWVYIPNAGVTITGQGTTSITIDFGSGSVNGTLYVNGVGTTCSGSVSLLNLNPIGINEIDGSNFWLGQNMPNPTTGLTNIEYNLPTAGEVKFDIMNLFGQKVYSIREEVSEGKHLIDLNVKDLSAGVYYYTIEFKGKRLVKKMVVNK